jgi:Flp pilus assembly protein TadD
VTIQPNFAAGLHELGILQAQQQNYPDAAKNLSRAVDLGLGDARLFNFLGIAYSRTARHQQAIDAYRKSLQLDPQLAEAHLNLAYAYEQIHKPQPARHEYQEACRLRSDFCRFVK